MFLRFNTNIPALSSYQALNENTNKLALTLERLSTGLRINRAGDDPSGLTIAARLRAQINAYAVASSNAQSGVSLFQTADESLDSTSSTLSRIYELALEAANDSLTNADRVEIQTEINSLISEVDRIADTTTFNKRNLLNGTVNAIVSTNNPTQINGMAVADVGNGGVYSIVIQATDAGSQQVQRSAIFTTDGSTTATTTTQLNSIASFSGMFATNLQLTLWGNGQSATVILAGTDTLDEAMNKISLAIADPSTTSDLDMEEAIVSGNEPNLARVITSGASSGSVEVSSAMPGILGEITFSGDQDLLTALGFTDVVSATEATFSVAATETTSLQTYTQSVKGERAYKLVPGVDVVFDSSIDLAMQSNSGSRPGIAIASGSETFYMAVNPNPLRFQITGNAGELDTKWINDMGSISLGVDKIDVVGEDKAGRAVTIVEDAMTTVSHERARIGAFENEYTRTISRLADIKLNTENSENEISGADMAAEMINFTKFQLLTNSSASMFTQANILPNAIWDLLYKG